MEFMDFQYKKLASYRTAHALSCLDIPVWAIYPVYNVQAKIVAMGNEMCSLELAIV